ncbi:hypothetical protein FOZ60_012265 [Perkinsus olseni]|uniref:PIPK domain-containing protein n=1 Tax=Perkinsus olseni TaxID=32597 RepID=A0A7J6NBQ9_PEROL|nr:hypothetical protein FOZ60_012265 [Perkinsus olseni]
MTRKDAPQARATGARDGRCSGPDEAFRNALEVGHFAMWLRRSTTDSNSVERSLKMGNLMEKILALGSASSEVPFTAAKKREMLHEVRHETASAGIIDAAENKPSVEEMKAAAWGKIEPLWRQFEADGGRNFVSSDTGAKSVGVDSANYALAYAMMVGIEATIRAGQQMDPTWPSAGRPDESNPMRIDNVMAAVRRSYLLPPSGTRLSPAHISKPNRLVFEEAAPEIFQYIRRRCCISDEQYLSSLCQRGFSLIEFVTNSKSGEFFFFSHDGKFMLKTISDEEAETLLLMLRDYAHHVTSHRSLLTRMLGLYRLHIGDRYRRWFFVSTSVFDTGSLGLHAQYDLKGSTSKNRKAGDTETVKKDLNWSEAGMKLHVPDECKDILITTHKADVEFLAQHGVTDYSVLVGVHDTESSDAGVHTKGVKLLRKDSVEEALADAKAGECIWSILHEQLIVILLMANSAIRAHILHYAATCRQRMGVARSSWPSFFNEPAIPETVLLLCLLGSPSDFVMMLFMLAHKYFIGIIDYLVPWSLKKRSERVLNACLCQGQSSSCQSPQVYASRQHVFFADKMVGPHDHLPTGDSSVEKREVRVEEVAVGEAPNHKN